MTILDEAEEKNKEQLRNECVRIAQKLLRENDEYVKRIEDNNKILAVLNEGKLPNIYCPNPDYLDCVKATKY